MRLRSSDNHYTTTPVSLNSTFTLSHGSGFDRNVIIFGANVSSSARMDSRKKYILIFGKVPSQRLDDTTLTAEKKYAIDFSE